MIDDRNPPAADAAGPFPFLDRLEAIFALPITLEEKAATLGKLLPADDAGKDATILRALEAAPPLTPDSKAAAAGAAQVFLGNFDAPGLAGRVAAAAPLIGQFGERLMRQPEAQRARLFERTSNLLGELNRMRPFLTDLEQSTLLAVLLFTPEATP